MEHEIPFGNSNRENGTTFLDFPLFLGIFQWDEPTKRVPCTAEPKIPEILTKWKAPEVSNSLRKHPFLLALRRWWRTLIKKSKSSINFVPHFLDKQRNVLKIMYRSNRSFNMPSPPGNPPGIWLFWNFLFKFPPTRAKMSFKCPTLGSIQVIKCPRPGDISQAQKWQKDGGNAFSCRTKSL